MAERNRVIQFIVGLLRTVTIGKNIHKALEAIQIIGDTFLAYFRPSPILLPIWHLVTHPRPPP